MYEPTQVAFFFSKILGTKICWPNGTTVGRLSDFLVDLDKPFPETVSLVCRLSWSLERRMIPWDAVRDLLPTGIMLQEKIEPASLPVPQSDSSSVILLRDFLLDKQIVDINGAKVVRVNDLRFISSGGKLLLVQVDVGLRGLLRRLGFEQQFVGFCEWFFDYTPRERLIDWHYVQPLADADRLRLQIPHSKLAELHPADLADIMEDMDVHERAAVVSSLGRDVIADVLEEMDPRVQVSIIKGLEPEKAADIIEEMSVDEAADLIADLPQNTANEILEELDDEYQEQVRELLAHDEDEAGGLMTTQFIALPPEKTVVEALAHIKREADEIDVIYYTYVVDADFRLLGVVNMRELLTHEIFTPLEQIMTTRVITAKLDDDAKYLAHLFGKYGFRGIPVVDEENRLKGVIRFKALLNILAPHLGK